MLMRQKLGGWGMSFDSCFEFVPLKDVTNFVKETLINSRFAQFNTHGILNFKMRHESSRFSSIPRVRGPICAICGGHCPFQDAPWACSAISCFLAITRLARPNRLNIWEPFLASPL